MHPALAERLRTFSRPFVFVVGKGGVGKTTTAAATGLYLADTGLATHLISTDPAHSLGDVFQVDLSPGPVPSPCSDHLLLEELDARAYARRWVERVAGPIAELVERGTYLDAEDARSLADLSLPGVDELMGALRLVELTAAAEAVVIDTAPTGHALRLLDAGSLIAGWAAALDAMARKAAAVGSALVGAPVHVPGEELVEELRRQVARFQDEVLARAAFLVVTRPGAVVAAETQHLIAALRQRGLGVAALLAVGGGAPDSSEASVFTIPLAEPPRGCAALRRWGEPAAELPLGSRAQAWDAGPADDTPFAAAGVEPVTAGRAAATGATSAAVERLATLPRSLFLFAGKGGVGKTTCACAFALHLTETRPAVLLSTDPAGSLPDVLGGPLPPDGLVLGGLRAIQVDAGAELARVEREYRTAVADAFRAVGLDTAAALDRAVVEELWGMAPPGMDELLGLVRIVRALESGTTLIIDPAPTGHFLRLLEMPGIALDWVHALMRLILKYHLAGPLDAITRDLLQFARDLKEFLARLTDPERTAAVVVTLEEPVVAAETHRLLERLALAGVPLEAMIVNRAAAGPRRRTGDRSVAAPAAEQAGGTPPTLFAPALSNPPIAPGPLRAFARRWEYAP